jgi:hypothetical protein
MARGSLFVLVTRRSLVEKARGGKSLAVWQRRGWLALLIL